MHIAILMTNTDETAFAQRHAKDGEKFAALFHRARPDWTFDVYSVKDDVFPTTFEGVDGVVITGSPASARDDAGWIPKLETLIRALHNVRMPMFGACFGHQVIATALGGKVELNPEGWVLGAVTTTDIAEGTGMSFYAAHKEQVSQLPKGAMPVAKSPNCATAGFSIGDHILTTQYHPEITTEFMAALITELRADLGDKISDQAEASLATDVDTDSLAAWAATFLEEASSRAKTDRPKTPASE
ncbi:MAG: type 1 glutamine amidotransferase [Sulfitobacter sp.]